MGTASRQSRSASGRGAVAVPAGRAEERPVDKTQVNPWGWQDQFGFSQGWKVDGAQSLVFVSGQIPATSDGAVVEGGFEAQARQVFENLGTVLQQAGATYESIVKVTVFLTDISNLPEYRRIKSQFIPGRQPAATAVEVRSLALPQMMIEVEAIAVV
jgi:reactive intermediate/imine deaminase